MSLRLGRSPLFRATLPWPAAAEAEPEKGGKRMEDGVGKSAMLSMGWGGCASGSLSSKMASSSWPSCSAGSSSASPHETRVGSRGAAVGVHTGGCEWRGLPAVGEE
jgi:hypothetical protein